MSSRVSKWWDRHATRVNGLTGEVFPEDPHRAAWEKAMELEAREGQARRQRSNDALTLYYGHDAHATFDDGGHMDLFGLPSSDVVVSNVIQWCTDTMVSHIVRNKVRPMFVTEKGDADLQEQAKGMQRAVEATFQECGIYGTMGTEACRSGELLDGGGVKFSPDYANSHVDHQLVWAHEFFVDPREARANDVRQLYHVYDVDREALLDFFKDASEETLEAIRGASPEGSSVSAAQIGGRVSDRLKVVECWHLPSGRVDLEKPASFGLDENGEFDASIEPGHDGRRVLCIERAGLIDEPWPFDHFPIAWYLPRKKPGSFWSRGSAETLAAAQLKINTWNARIDAILHLHAVPRLIVWARARLNRGKLSNDLATVLTSSQPPGSSIMRLDPNSVPRDLLERVDKLIAWAEKQFGLSELSIAAQKPAGVDHAPGMQHLADTESIRHTTSFRAWEQFHLDAATIVVECIRLLAQRDADYTVLFGSSKELQAIKWRDVDLARDKYHLKTWPTNLLPMTPGPRISRVLDMMGTNPPLITPEQALQALDFPDIEALLGDRVAERENIEQYLKRASKQGAALDADTIPHSYLNLQLAQQMARDKLNRAEADGESDASLDGIRAFYEQTTKLLQSLAPPVPPGPEQGPPPSPPPGPPGPAGVAPPNTVLTENAA